MLFYMVSVLYIFISGCGKKLLERCVAKRLTLFMFDIAYVLLGLCRGGTIFFSP